MSEQMRRAWVELPRAPRPATHAGAAGARGPALGRLRHGALHRRGAARARASCRGWCSRWRAPRCPSCFPKLWAERRSVQEIRLKGLGRKAGERLVRQVLGEQRGRRDHRAAGAAGRRQRLLPRRADPRAWPRERATRCPARCWRWWRRGWAGSTGEARRVLRAASVFGEVCWESAVAALLGGAERTTLAGEWLSTPGGAGGPGCGGPRAAFPASRSWCSGTRCSREGAYAMLTEEDRKLGHRLAGEWLEQHGETDPMVLAGHFERGGAKARARRASTCARPSRRHWACDLSTRHRARSRWAWAARRRRSYGARCWACSARRARWQPAARSAPRARRRGGDAPGAAGLAPLGSGEWR